MAETIEMKEPAEEQAAKKPYEFRKLAAPDVFPMFRIISKIGINQFSGCLEKDSIKNLVLKATGAPDEDGNREEAVSVVGLRVILEMANVLFANLPRCEKGLYDFLSSVSNLSVEEVKALSMADFFEMVVDLIKKDEFLDFFRVAVKLFK